MAMSLDVSFVPSLNPLPFCPGRGFNFVCQTLTCVYTSVNIYIFSGERV